MSDKTLSQVDLVGVADIARRCDVTSAAVQQWRARYPDSFPDPAFILERPGGGSLSYWDWEVVDEWRRGKGLGR